MSDNVEFALTEKGKRKACHQGYCYNRNKTSATDPGLTYWVCENYYKNLKCKARMHIRGEAVVKTIGDHNHSPNSLRKEVLHLRNKIKRSATSTNEPTTSLLIQATEEYPSAVVAQLSSESVLKRTVQQCRQKSGNSPSEPSTLVDLLLPREYRQLKDGTEFLMYDSGPTNDRILIFSTQKNLQYLAESTSIFSDGTFSAAPGKLFSQLYSIHACILSGAVIPLVYALLPNKTMATYNRLFGALKNLQPQFTPIMWMTDFELAAINAIRQNFPGVVITGCFFHMQQCMWRKIQSLGLTNAYSEADGHFALCCKSLSCLAFVLKSY